MSHTPLTDAVVSRWSGMPIELIGHARALELSRADMLALLHDIREEIDGMIDIRDGEDGTQQPNWAMSLSSRIDEILSKAGAK